MVVVQWLLARFCHQHLGILRGWFPIPFLHTSQRCALECRWSLPCILLVSEDLLGGFQGADILRLADVQLVTWQAMHVPGPRRFSVCWDDGTEAQQFHGPADDLRLQLVRTGHS